MPVVSTVARRVPDDLGVRESPPDSQGQDFSMPAPPSTIDVSIDSPSHGPHAAAPVLIRVLIRGAFLSLLLMMVVGAIPFGAFPDDGPQHTFYKFVGRLGLTPGPWMMFAPEPVVDNGWLTATVPSDSQPTVVWKSPEWRDVDGWQKFRHFQSINFYRRLARPENRAAANDFAAYLQRTCNKVPENQPLTLDASGLRLLPPVDGEIPPAEEVTWMLHRQTIARAEPTP